ncbi:MAG: preprotein translocase subunit SecE [Elusimicrobiota bacterium]|jgi:preprotein translocase subunit SecE|nr:preprotein translocase subunit SecE [Elusimicrobiota bacterium]
MNFIKSVIIFFKEAYHELTKVIWLGRKEAIGTTIIVVLFIIIMSIFVSVVDLILGKLIGVVL